MQTLIRHVGAVLLSAASACPVFAGDSYAGVSGLKFSVVDMNSSDGIDAGYTILGGTLTAQIKTAASDGGAVKIKTKTVSFDSWPDTRKMLGNSRSGGAEASYFFGSDSFEVEGSSGSTGSFLAGLSLSLNIVVTPYTQLMVSGNLTQSMTGSRMPEEEEHTQAATDLSLSLGGGFSYFGDGIAFRKHLTGEFAYVPLGWADASTADTWSFSQAQAFSLSHDAPISAFERVRTVEWTLGALGNASPPVSPVPEPATVALMLAGLAVVGLAARRRATGTL